MHHLAVAVLTALVVPAASACASSAGDPPPAPPPPPSSATLRLETVATGLDFPVFLTHAPGDGTRLFVVEKAGRVRIIANGSVLPTPFVDLSPKVSGGSEQGLLGMAFHPDYATNGIVILDYTDRSGDTHLARFQVSATDANQLDPASEHTILTVTQPASNHNGGMVTFGPIDGNLYVGLGDGGSAGDPQGNGQNRATLLATILRLRVASNGQVSVPADNPFPLSSGFRAEIWSYGLRNPWRFSFDRANGDLYIGDVGQGAREEIDLSAAADGAGRGLDFGWNLMEGTACYPSGSSCDRTGLTLPVLDYDHSQGCSVTSGYVYRGTALTGMQGVYFYADYCGGWVRSFRWAGGQVTEEAEWTSLAPGGSITSFGEDAAGELYLLTQAGGVYRIGPA
jgi:glucose/arabinose dehydrogenase